MEFYIKKRFPTHFNFKKYTLIHIASTSNYFLVNFILQWIPFYFITKEEDFFNAVKCWARIKVEIKVCLPGKHYLQNALRMRIPWGIFLQWKKRPHWLVIGWMWSLVPSYFLMLQLGQIWWRIQWGCSQVLRPKLITSGSRNGQDRDRHRKLLMSLWPFQSINTSQSALS